MSVCFMHNNDDDSLMYYECVRYRSEVVESYCIDE